MPTTVTSSIGTSSRDYSTIQAWWNAVGDSQNLVSDDEIHVGELYDDSDFNENVTLSNSTTDATRYHILRVADGEEYDPVSNTGVRWTSGTTDNSVVSIQQDYLKLTGPMLMESSYIGTANMRCWQISSCTGATISGVLARFAATNIAVENCIFVGGAGAASSMTDGLEFDGTGTVYNCLAYDVADVIGSVGTGFDIDNASVTIENCAAYNSQIADFDTVASVTEDYNVSSDTTAAGSNSRTNAVDTDDMVDPANGDYTPLRGGNLIDYGKTVTVTPGFDKVQHGNDGGSFEIGPFNFDTKIRVQATISAEQTLTAPTAGLYRPVSATIEATQTLTAPTAGLYRPVAATIEATQTLTAPGVGLYANASTTIEATQTLTPNVPRYAALSGVIIEAHQILSGTVSVPNATPPSYPALATAQAGTLAAQSALAHTAAAQTSMAEVQAAQNAQAGVEAAQSPQAGATAASAG